jgi:hypothetical protein
MIDPPPMPVRPTRKPTPNPKRMIAGSIEMPGVWRGRWTRPLFHLVPF